MHIVAFSQSYFQLYSDRNAMHTLENVTKSTYCSICFWFAYTHLKFPLYFSFFFQWYHTVSSINYLTVSFYSTGGFYVFTPTDLRFTATFLYFQWSHLLFSAWFQMFLQFFGCIFTFNDETTRSHKTLLYSVFLWDKIF